MQLILEETFDLENEIELNESTGDKTYVIKGTFSTPDMKNRNGRIYAKKLWEENVGKYQSEISGNTVNTLMEKEHPPRTSVDPWAAVAQIRKLEMREGLVYGEAELLNIQETEGMRALIDKGIKIGVSSRGVGSMKGDIVEKFNLITYDIVSTPSDYNANLQGFNESMILEGVEITENEKGQYICTPEGCTLQETEIEESKGLKCPKCGSADVSYVAKTNNSKIKCKECDKIIALKESEKIDEAETVYYAQGQVYQKDKSLKSGVIDVETGEIATDRKGQQVSIKDIVKNPSDHRKFFYTDKNELQKLIGKEDFAIKKANINFDKSLKEGTGVYALYSTNNPNGKDYKVFTKASSEEEAIENANKQLKTKWSAVELSASGVKKAKEMDKLITEGETECPCETKADSLIEALNAFATEGKISEAEQADIDLKAKFASYISETKGEDITEASLAKKVKKLIGRDGEVTKASGKEYVFIKNLSIDDSMKLDAAGLKQKAGGGGVTITESITEGKDYYRLDKKGQDSLWIMMKNLEAMDGVFKGKDFKKDAWENIKKNIKNVEKGLHKNPAEGSIDETIELDEASYSFRKSIDRTLDKIEKQDDAQLKLRVVDAYSSDIADGSKVVTPGPGQIKVNGRPI